ncbi:hypothetical protein PPL_09170 [Heterostelium album PN500]|uniref:Uncharacterized protein n=1 Tax=Heterostelium pallidum (strain ATCC 26659 / Pp 5 / PN500) TaxID=670386 RepID=D3BKT8_HETP5|nr:hypothetical protein PPL_09170 [Heterostelium album PN500]EFA78518.1 hypothetical protein PPL_09170 [Heterostelium album PN500]|eukprot:XP_020430642.1 hypothetical protein PPL_09170 [Heterostelium album PN500]
MSVDKTVLTRFFDRYLNFKRYNHDNDFSLKGLDITGLLPIADLRDEQPKALLLFNVVDHFMDDGQSEDQIKLYNAFMLYVFNNLSDCSDSTELEEIVKIFSNLDEVFDVKLHCFDWIVSNLSTLNKFKFQLLFMVLKKIGNNQSIINTSISNTILRGIITFYDTIELEDLKSLRWLGNLFDSKDAENIELVSTFLNNLCTSVSPNEALIDVVYSLFYRLLNAADIFNHFCLPENVNGVELGNYSIYLMCLEIDSQFLVSDDLGLVDYLIYRISYNSTQSLIILDAYINRSIAIPRRLYEHLATISFNRGTVYNDVDFSLNPVALEIVDRPDNEKITILKVLLHLYNDYTTPSTTTVPYEYHDPLFIAAFLNMFELFNTPMYIEESIIMIQRFFESFTVDEFAKPLPIISINLFELFEHTTTFSYRMPLYVGKLLMSLSESHVTVIHDVIEYIGSDYCLFSRAPLSLLDRDIGFIPEAERISCLENLEVLTVTFILIEMYFDFNPNLCINSLDKLKINQMKINRDIIQLFQTTSIKSVTVIGYSFENIIDIIKHIGDSTKSITIIHRTEVFMSQAEFTESLNQIMQILSHPKFKSVQEIKFKASYCGRDYPMLNEAIIQSDLIDFKQFKYTVDNKYLTKYRLAQDEIDNQVSFDISLENSSDTITTVEKDDSWCSSGYA